MHLGEKLGGGRAGWLHRSSPAPAAPIESFLVLSEAFSELSDTKRDAKKESKKKQSIRFRDLTLNEEKNWYSQS